MLGKMRLPAQIECGRRCRIRRLIGELHLARRVAVRPESSVAARFGFVGVYRKGVVVAATGMRDVVSATAQRTRGPCIDEIENERRLHTDRRMQRRRWIPRTKAHAGDIFAR